MSSSWSPGRTTGSATPSCSWRASSGSRAALLVGGLNFKVAEPGLEGVLNMAGRRDALAAAGPTCIPSDSAPSRLDYVLANPEALGG